jgi:nucleolar protein 56
MKAYLGYSVVGVFAFNPAGAILDKEFFKKDAKQISIKLNNVKNEFLDEELVLLRRLAKKGVNEFFGAYPKSGEFQIQRDHDSIGENTTRSVFREIARKEKWAGSQAELNKILSSVGMESSKTELRNVDKDKIGMRVVGMIDELNKNINTISEHLREWYGLYFPEINGLLKDNEKFATFVADKTLRENFERDGRKLDIETAGMEFDDNDLESVKRAGLILKQMYAERKALENYLAILGKKVMPNMSAVAGALLAFRLVSQAGGLDKLVKLPSSTIQLLGAEKALFRFLKKQGKAPKHGIIFYHPAVISAPIPIRGKIARIVAAKITMAARIDFYSGNDKSAAMKEELNAVVNNALTHFKERG